MNIFEYLIYLGIVQILYVYIFSNWVFPLISVPFMMLKGWFARLGLNALKALNYYLYISLLGLLTLFALERNSSLLLTLLIIGIGLFTAFFSLTQGAVKAEEEARRNFDYEALEWHKYNSYFMIGSPIYFIVVLFVPSLATTLPVLALFSLFSWIFNLPIIGMVLGFLGILFMLAILFNAFLLSSVGLAWLIAKVKNEKK